MAEESTTLTQNAVQSSHSSDKDPTEFSGLVEKNSYDTVPNKELCFKKLKLVWGYTSGIIMALAWTTSASCAQGLGGFVPAFELNCFRFGTQLLITAPIVLQQKSKFPTDKKQAFFLAVYAVITLFNNLPYYEASIYLPVGVFGGTEATCLVVLSSILALITGEKCSVPIPVSVVLSITGIICLTQPSFLFGNFSSMPETHSVCGDDAVANLFSGLNATTATPESMFNITTQPHNEGGILSDQTKGFLLLAVFSVMYVGSLAILSRYLYEVNIFVILCVTSLVGTTSSAMIMLFVETPTFPTNPICILLLLGQSVSGAAASSLGVVAIQFVSPVIYSLMSNFQLFFLLIAQYTALRSVNPGHRNWMEIVGAILVFAASAFGSFYSFYRNWKDEKASEPLSNQRRRT